MPLLSFSQSHLFGKKSFFLKNYGDESDARGLVNPNVYANIGVYEQDFFQARSQEQVSSHQLLSQTLVHCLLI